MLHVGQHVLAALRAECLFITSFCIMAKPMPTKLAAGDKMPPAAQMYVQWSLSGLRGVGFRF